MDPADLLRFRFAVRQYPDGTCEVSCRAGSACAVSWELGCDRVDGATIASMIDHQRTCHSDTPGLFERALGRFVDGVAYAAAWVVVNRRRR